MKKLYNTIGLIFLCLCANAQWAAVGTGVNSSSDVLNIYNGQLISAGRYSPIAKWDGNTWTDFTTSGSPSATAIFVEGNNLYAGRQFTGGDAFKQISHYNGTTWSMVGSSINSYNLVAWNTNSRWWSIFKFNSQLYGVYDGGVLKFDSDNDAFINVGNPVSDLGSLLYAVRYAGTINNTVYFSGMSDGIQRVFTWNDSQWDTVNLAGYPLRAIMGMKVVNNELFIGGFFQNTSSALSSMLKWNGTNLTSVLGYGPGFPSIQELYSTPTHLYARTFLNVTGLSIWNGSGFTGLSGEMFQQAGSLNAVAEDNGTLFAGGFFTMFDSVPANNIVQRSAFSGISEMSHSKPISIYPNPAQNYIELEPSNSIRSAYIFNTLGLLCQEIILSPGETRLSLIHLSAGVYILKVKEDQTIQLARIVKH